ncbi:hypothetical protein TSTA_125120 [Talaromyces stipitatus ATCC 10500]|uniref:Uncharacterized protein n=1 Tax=Talaromyces stipitatus (strain ATCC 10500 / CBS 375.48 / QM 6759 / NRRL 1006) TaxID=441959 RepID=B8MCH8_TALSN|nr:uncharacterized protein TSTA_125120 [Talaromyces stipitatus ATCC 10500]EED18795.1 hypothetical protein TSTA_125120 [Talaromyces stipitatus ATCC 10500]
MATASTISSKAVVPSSSHVVPATTNLPDPNIGSTTPGRGKGLSNGTLAGAIVGSIAGTALLVFLAAWLFFRKSQNTRSGFRRYEGGEYTTAAMEKAGRSDHPDQNRLPSAELKATGANDQIFSGNTGEKWLLTSSLSRYIPEPASDETVVKHALTFFDQASLHVDNYYSQTLSVSSLLSSGKTSQISDFGTPYLPGSLTSLLENSTTRRLIITHTLVHSLLQAIQPHSAARESLLPLPFTIGPLKQVQQAINSDKAFYTWRMLTAYLSQLATPEAAKRNLAVQDTAVHKFVETFTSSFAPYADSSHSRGNRVRHLGTVTTTAADLGRWLFGQPCTFEFVYTSPAGSGEIVVLPAIVKVLDEEGQRLANKVILCEAVTAKL